MNHYILHFKGEPLPPSERASSKDAIKLLNLKIIQEGGDTKKVEALAAIFKPNCNYVITFTNDILPEDNTVVKSIIKSALAPRHPTAEASRDAPWTKVIVHNVSIIDSFGCQCLNQDAS